MILKKNDFVEIEFTGRVKGGEIFDSNIKKDLEKINTKGNPAPFKFCLGEGMFIKGIDSFLIGKEVGEYNISLKPADAFGKRNPKMIQLIPMKVFREHNINPIPGITFNFDGKLAKILTISGGRGVMVDFNNPIAGKDVEYYVKIIRKIEDKNEKIDSLNEFFFRQKLKFEIIGKRLILEMPKGSSQFALMFKDKYKELIGLDLEIKEVEFNKKEATKEEPHKK